MIAQDWVAEFCTNPAPPPDLIDLHVADAAIAFFAACRAAEARALATALNHCEPAAIGAIIRRSECDAIHVASCITPAGAVIPVALATALHHGNLKNFDRAVAAGFAAGIRIGLGLGGAAAMTTGIWPTYFATPVMAAITAAIGMGLDADQITGAIGLAAAGTAGRAGRNPGTPSGRWLVFGEAVAKGLHAAKAAAAGFRGDPTLLTAASASPNSDIAATGLKPFVAARQTVNAVLAFQRILAKGIDPAEITAIEIGVPTLNAEMVARCPTQSDRLSFIASMHTQIATAALRPDLLFNTEPNDEPDLKAFAGRITIVADTSLDQHLPAIWAGSAVVTTQGATHDETCLDAPGDPNDPGIAQTVRTKAERMLSGKDRSICLELLHPANGPERQIRLSRLWHAMQQAAR